MIGAFVFADQSRDSLAVTRLRVLVVITSLGTAVVAVIVRLAVLLLERFAVFLCILRGRGVLRVVVVKLAHIVRRNTAQPRRFSKGSATALLMCWRNCYGYVVVVIRLGVFFYRCLLTDRLFALVLIVFNCIRLLEVFCIVW